MRKIIAIIFITGCLTTALFVNEAKADNGNYSSNSLIINLKPVYRNLADASFSRFNSLKKLNLENGVSSVTLISQNPESSLYGSYKLTFSKSQNIPLLVARYQKNPYVNYAEPDYQLALNLYSPNDTYYSQQWNLAKINTPQAWAYDGDSDPYGGSSSIIVAVVDTGVAYESYGSFVKAPDLASTNFVAGYDFVGNDSHPNDDDGHGTSVAEIIAATTNNSSGIAGIAFNISIMPIRVIAHNQLASAATVAEGIDYARTHGADVINISLGGDTSATVLHNAIKAADDAGIIIVASTGNDGDSSIYYPAAYPEVISVGSTNSSDQISSFSNYGSGLDLVAPGQSILAEYCTNPPTCSSFQMSYLSGTSQAAPHVTAAAALLLSYNADSSRVKDYLINSADDLGSAGYDTRYGYGRLNLQKAFELTEDTTNPVLNISVPYNNQKINGGKLNCTGRVSDNGSGVSSLTINGTEIDIKSDFSYEKLITLDEGINTLQYVLTDNASNSVTATRRVFSYPKNNILVGMGPGELPRVRGYNYSDQITGEFLPYLNAFSGGVNVISADINNDGTEEIITAPIGQGGPHVRVLTSRAEGISNFMAYIESFRGGVNIAAGDVDRDGQTEIITAAGPGGGPHVRVFDYRGNFKYQFFAYIESFRGGVQVASGDVDNDGVFEIITAAGPGGGPHVRVFDYEGNLKGQFMAYAEDFRGGVNVATGDLDSDGTEEIITAPLSSGGPHVRVFDYEGNLKGQFFVYSSSFRGGLNLSAGDYDNDGTYEIICGVKSGMSPEVKIFDLNGSLKTNYYPFWNSFTGGITVAGFN